MVKLGEKRLQEFLGYVKILVFICFFRNIKTTVAEYQNFEPRFRYDNVSESLSNTIKLIRYTRRRTARNHDPETQGSRNELGMATLR